MSNKIIYGVTGIFDTPDSIMNAAEKVANKGYKKFDVNTPYPVHGMDSAMKLKHSKLGYFALAFGLTGTTIAIMLMTFTMVFEYPLIIGGKPFFALPAFIPVTFELTVLLAAVATSTSMIAFFFKFPNNAHPLHDTPYMEKVSSDKYGVVIEAKDKLFNEEEIRAFFKELGASEVETVYFDEEELAVNNKIIEPKFVIGLIAIALVVGGATYFTLNKLMFMTPFNWMMNQEKISAQEPSDFWGDGFSMRMPVEGTVAKGFKPYPYKDAPEEAGEYMINPVSMTEENIQKGQEKYDVFCSPCHGYHGEGDSRLRGQFPIPPSLHSNKMLNEWSDGRIYHVITVGQNTMPGYNRQVTPEERWQIINYIRTMQRALNANEEDLK
jgi:mono/diheme cytochrome c family protein